MRGAQGLCSHGFCTPWAPGVGQSWPKTGPLYLSLLGLGGREDMLVAMETFRHRDWDSCADSGLVINKVSLHLHGPASHGCPCFPVSVVALSAKPSAPARDGQRYVASPGEDRSQLCGPGRGRQQTICGHVSIGPGLPQPVSCRSLYQVGPPPPTANVCIPILGPSRPSPHLARGIQPLESY